MSDSNYIPMGKIVGAFGVKGWLKLKTSISNPLSLKKYKYIYIKQEYKYISLAIDNLSFNNRLIQIKFIGIDDRTIAETYKNLDIYILRHQLPKTNVDEFYWVDLLNMEVINQNNITLGRVINLLETGPTSVLIIKDKQEYMIPFVDIYIKEVDLAQNKIHVFWELDY